jgi:DNA (cytosine-5)-methyltransferase 1
MDFPDSLDKPGRTMLTSEASVNRSSHIVSDQINKKLRFISPIEAERLNEFPDNWTDTGMPKKFRYFTMGNALVVGVVRKISKRIEKIISRE